MTFLALIWNNKITRALAGAVLAALGAMGFHKLGERSGRRKQRTEAHIDDLETAVEVRRRVDVAKGKSDEVSGIDDDDLDRVLHDLRDRTRASND